jgi:hypothetical protein
MYSVSQARDKGHGFGFRNYPGMVAGYCCMLPGGVFQPADAAVKASGLPAFSLSQSLCGLCERYVPSPCWDTNADIWLSLGHERGHLVEFLGQKADIWLSFWDTNADIWLSLGHERGHLVEFQASSAIGCNAVSGVISSL